jgi:predicted nucleotidyltransferase
MSDRVSDCPPLLAPGEHELTVHELQVLCVNNFALSKTRSEIMQGFQRIVDDLERLKIRADIVVDGSFLTQEIDPDDIDFAVVISPEFYEGCSSEQLKYLEWIRDEFSIKTTHLCDCYLCVEYPKDHPEYFDGIQNRGFWVNLYAESVIYKQKRGVAIVHIGGAGGALASEPAQPVGRIFLTE